MNLDDLAEAAGGHQGAAARNDDRARCDAAVCFRLWLMGLHGCSTGGRFSFFFLRASSSSAAQEDIRHPG
jgi:hypothetical protein